MRTVRGTRLLWVMSIGLVALAGCRDSGLPDRNLPLDDAEQRAPLYPLYEPAPAGSIRYEDAEWVVAGRPLRIPAALLVPVASESVEAWVLATDAAPHDRLYVRTGDAWTPLARALATAPATPAH